MDLLNAILLQANASEGGGWSGMIMIIAMIVIFYFFMIRPQSKKQKEIKKAREALKKGDKIVSAGGIHGRIKDLTDTVVIMEIAPGVTVKIDKASVYALPQTNETSKSEDKKQKAEAVESVEIEDGGNELEAAAGKASSKKKK